MNFIQTALKGSLNRPINGLYLVVAIPLKDIASKTDEIFRCKKHTILAGNCWSYIFVIKVRTRVHPNVHQQNSKTRIHNNLRPQMRVRPASLRVAG